MYLDPAGCFLVGCLGGGGIQGKNCLLSGACTAADVTFTSSHGRRITHAQFKLVIVKGFDVSVYVGR